MRKVEKILDNGLRAILVEKPGFVQSFAMAAVPSGGLNRVEKDGENILHHRSGVAHFLEHQMFYIDGQDVTEMLSDAGANSNAYTSLDKTAYYIWTDQDPEKGIELLLDFVQNLDITEQTIEKEKGIILSEYGMYDQQPESRIYKEGLISLYHNHPIRDDILGSIEDIKAMDEKDLRGFYESFYDPGRMTFVMVSGQPLEKSLALLEEHERRYPSRKAPTEVLFPQEPEEVVREYFEDTMDVLMPYALFSVKLKPASDQEEAYRLDLLANLWLEYFFSPLNPEYAKWLSQGIITQSLSAQAEYSTKYAYLQVFTQSEKPEEFFELCKRLMKEKPIMPQKAFQALKNSEIGSVIRSRDQFETLANDLLECAMDGVPYEKMASLCRTISREQIEQWLETTNLEHQAQLVIRPRTGSQDLQD